MPSLLKSYIFPQSSSVFFPSIYRKYLVIRSSKLKISSTCCHFSSVEFLCKIPAITVRSIDPKTSQHFFDLRIKEDSKAHLKKPGQQRNYSPIHLTFRWLEVLSFTKIRQWFDYCSNQYPSHQKTTTYLGWVTWGSLWIIQPSLNPAYVPQHPQAHLADKIFFFHFFSVFSQFIHYKKNNNHCFILCK